MKRLLLIALVSSLCIVGVFAQSDSNTTPETDSNFVYKANQKGDQFAKLNLSLDLPWYVTDLSSVST